MAVKKKLVINTKWCKGCNVCATFCPKNALKLKGDKITLADPEGCTLCGLCELRCPDYAIYLEEVEEA